MKLKYCTVTGFAEPDTNDMLALAKAYNPFAEFGFLFSMDRMGQKRYPMVNYIGELMHPQSKWFKRSLHLCGTLAKDLPRNMKMPGLDMKENLQHFDRIQINADFSKLNYLDYVEPIKALAPMPVIIQYNRANARAWDVCFQHIENTQVLFDASRGKGVPPGVWMAPLYPGKFHGYAGGIGADNIEDALKKISEVAGNNEVWIDMESGVRDANDDLDPRKCAKVFEIAKKYV